MDLNFVTESLLISKIRSRPLTPECRLLWKRADYLSWIDLLGALNSWMRADLSLESLWSIRCRLSWKFSASSSRLGVAIENVLSEMRSSTSRSLPLKFFGEDCIRWVMTSRLSQAEVISFRTYQHVFCGYYSLCYNPRQTHIGLTINQSSYFFQCIAVGLLTKRKSSCVTLKSIYSLLVHVNTSTKHVNFHSSCVDNSYNTLQARQLTTAAPVGL